MTSETECHLVTTVLIINFVIITTPLRFVDLAIFTIFFFFSSQRKFATPLLLAASGGHKVVVEVLIAHGASASDEDAVGIRLRSDTVK